jgi:hypothetical protein
MDVVSSAGKGLAAMLRAYFDESGTHKGAPALCIAGYVAEPEQRKEMCQSWAKMLKKEGKGLDVFHMVDLKHLDTGFRFIR